MLSSTVKRGMRDLVKIYFGLFEIRVKFKINLKLDISMPPLRLLMIFSTLYTALPHNLIKDKLNDLIERIFIREGFPYLACNDRPALLLRKNLKTIMHGLVKMYVMH